MSAQCMNSSVQKCGTAKKSVVNKKHVNYLIFHRCICEREKIIHYISKFSVCIEHVQVFCSPSISKNVLSERHKFKTYDFNEYVQPTVLHFVETYPHVSPMQTI